MKAVVMAGGEGSRLRPMTINRPKPLAPVGCRPIMEHILLLLKDHGLLEVVTTLHYLSDEIIATFGDGSDLGMSIKHSIEKDPLGTAGAVKMADHLLEGEPFVIISGDALTSIDLTKAIAWHKEKGSMATLILKRVPNPLEFGVVITREDGHIDRFLEKPGWSEVFSDTVNTGIYILEPEVLALMEPDRSYDWSQDIFPKMLREGMPLYGYIADEYWSDIGNLEQYRQAQNDLLSGDAGLPVPGREVSPGIWVGDRTVVEDGVQLTAPVCIGSDCRIKKGAQLGPNTVIGDGTIVDCDAVVKESVVWEGCYIGQAVQAEGAILCRRCTIKKEAILREDVVVGDNTLVDVGATIKAKVKVWPDKHIERGATLTMSLVSGSRWKGSFFRELGVGGLSNIEVTPEFAVRLGLAYGSTLPTGSRVVTGRDSSKSSRMTKRAVISSLLSTGCQVIDMRSAPLPITRHHTRAIGATGAFNIRKMPGSARMTLMELLDGQGRYISSAAQRKIESNFFREEFRRTDPDEVGTIDVATRAAEMYEQDFFGALEDYRLSSSMRLVIDYGFSSISPIFPSFLHRLGVESVSLNAVNDAKAAPRTDEEIMVHLRRVAQIAASLHADLGILFVNEGERMMVVDDRGLPLSGLQLLGAAAMVVAASSNSAKIAVDVTTPDSLIQALKAKGADVMIGRAGARGLMACAESGEVSFAGDSNGGFIFPLLTPGFDAMYALARLLWKLERTGARLSDITNDLPPLNVATLPADVGYEDKGTVMRLLAEELGDWGTLDLTDGIKSRRPGAWVLALPDPFEPMVKIYAEADSLEASYALASEWRERAMGMVKRT